MRSDGAEGSRGVQVGVAVAVVALHVAVLGALLSLQVRPVEPAQSRRLDVIFIEPVRMPPPPPPQAPVPRPAAEPPAPPRTVRPAAPPPKKPARPPAAPRRIEPAPSPADPPARPRPAQARPVVPAASPAPLPPPEPAPQPPQPQPNPPLTPMPDVPAPPPWTAMPTAPPQAQAAPRPPALEIGLACPTQVAPQMPRRALLDGIGGVVRAQARIRAGRVLEVEILSGPPVFHEAVRSAMRQYRCVGSGDAEVLAVQEFRFEVE